MQKKKPENFILKYYEGSQEENGERNAWLCLSSLYLDFRLEIYPAVWNTTSMANCFKYWRICYKQSLTNDNQFHPVQWWNQLRLLYKLGLFYPSKGSLASTFIWTRADVSNLTVLSVLVTVNSSLSISIYWNGGGNTSSAESRLKILGLRLHLTMIHQLVISFCLYDRMDSSSAFCLFLSVWNATF